jgi:hypothetical protein
MGTKDVETGRNEATEQRAYSERYLGICFDCKKRENYCGNLILFCCFDGPRIFKQKPYECGIFVPFIHYLVPTYSSGYLCCCAWIYGAKVS